MAKIEPLVGCGHEWIPWSNLFNTYTTMTHIGLGDFRGALPEFFHILRGHNLAVLNTMREKKGETSLEWYLRATRQFQATDLRDKVYSLLGLARERDRCNLVPDYDKTNTPESLYAKVVQHFIDIDHSLNILSYFRKPFEIPASPPTPWQGYKVSNLGMARWRPTWMPNFDKTVLDKHHPLPLLGKVSYKASGARKAQANISSELRILSAKGIFFDYIGSVMEPYPESMIFVQYLRRVATLFGKTADSYYYYNCIWERDSRCYLDRTEAQWRTMCADRSPIESEMHYDVQHPTFKLVTPAHESFHSMYSVYLHHEAVPYDFVPPPGLLHPDIDPRRLCDLYVEPFSLACKKAMEGRALFVTRCGFAGLGPLDARPGDVVAILFGADVPFVLRRDGEQWAFLGDCYVHGIMQGELIALAEELGKKLNGPKSCNFNIL